MMDESSRMTQYTMKENLSKVFFLNFITNRSRFSIELLGKVGSVLVPTCNSNCLFLISSIFIT